MTPDQLRAIRAKLDLTQADLAAKLQVSRVTITRWETGVLEIDERTRLAVEHLRCKQVRK